MGGQQSKDEKKQHYVDILNNHRATLVENMNVRDGLDDYVIQYGIAKPATMNRIKAESTTSEEQVRHLLNYLLTRPVEELENFVTALTDTNQCHIARLFYCGMVQIGVSTTETTPSHDWNQQAQWEEAIVQQIKGLEERFMSHNPPFQSEIEELVFLLAGHLLLMRVEHHSIILFVKCPTITVLDFLWLLIKSGGLTNMFQQMFVTEDLLKQLGLIKMQLRVEMQRQDYMDCRAYMLEKATHGSGEEGIAPDGSPELSKSAKHIGRKTDETDTRMELKFHTYGQAGTSLYPTKKDPAKERAEEEDIPEKDFQKILRTNRDRLKKAFDLTGSFPDTLATKSIITEQHLATIKKKETSCDKADVLLEVLGKRAPGQIKAFFMTLKEVAENDGEETGAYDVVKQLIS